MKKKTRPHSLRARLLLLFAVAVLAAWAVASAIAVYEVAEEMGELLEEARNGQFASRLDYSGELVGELAEEILDEQLLPWLVTLPLLFLAVFFLLRREFLPLKKVADAISRRRPDDDAPIDGTGLPKEIQPFIVSLNALFVRVSDLLSRERRFTSDAAHELRSPLAGLRVQAEVAQMSDDDPAARAHALQNLTKGIDRTTRLVDQLLALSRLDSLSALTDVQTVDWRRIVRESAGEFAEEALRRNVTLCVEEDVSAPPEREGQRLLLLLLCRNLIDNALRHASPGGCVKVAIEQDRIHVMDDGPGVSPGDLGRLGERFFRAAGQSETGTGLGLSIVKRVADLHGIRVAFANRPEGGLCVTLYLNEVRNGNAAVKN